jgi:hypothetical protein
MAARRAGFCLLNIYSNCNLVFFQLLPAAGNRQKNLISTDIKKVENKRKIKGNNTMHSFFLCLAAHPTVSDSHQ